MLLKLLKVLYKAVSYKRVSISTKYVYELIDLNEILSGKKKYKIEFNPYTRKAQIYLVITYQKFTHIMFCCV